MGEGVIEEDKKEIKVQHGIKLTRMKRECKLEPDL